MSWFYKKLKPDFDVKQIENLASELEGSKTKSSWLGRKVVIGKEDLSPRIKAVLKDIKANLGSLEGEARTHVITLLTKLDKLYNTAGKVGWFNPTGKAAKSLKSKLEEKEKKDLLASCEEKCLGVSNEQTAEDRPQRLIELFKKMSDCKEVRDLLQLKKQAVQLVYGPIQEPLLNDQEFVENLFKKIRATLCIQDRPFFSELSQGPKAIVLAKNDEAKKIYQQIAGRSRKQTTDKVELDKGIEVQVPGDFKDSIQRSVFKQIDAMKDSCDVKDFSREKLSKMFLLDLRAKLGPKRECLIEPLLVSIEQACDNYVFDKIAKQMNEGSGGDIYQVLENTIRHAVRIKIPKDENQSVEALIESDYPMRIQDLGDKSGIIRKFTPMEVRSTLTLKFKMPEGAPTNLSDYCQEVSLVVSESKTPIDEKQYLIVS